MTPLSDKVALVTGGASGIGAAIVTRLLEAGAHVVSVDVDESGLERSKAEAGAQLRTAVVNVTDSASVQRGIAGAVDELGRLDLVFNVAGAVWPGTILDGSDEDWNATVAVSLTGCYLVTKSSAAVMRDSGRGGAIVNVSSLNAHVPMFGGSSYAAAKAGVESFTKSAALELAAHNIRVNAVLPGLVATPMTAALLSVPDLERDYLQRIPQGRPADPDDIAGPCLYLASDDARYITGTSLVVDGGWEITNYPDLRPYV